MNPIRYLLKLINQVIHVKRWKHRTRIIWQYYLTSKRNIEPVFVVSAGRDGSNLLVDYLNSLPGVAIGGEVLSPTLYYGIRRRFMTKAGVLRHIKYSLHSLDGEVCGAKLHFAQMRARQLTLDDIRQAFPTAKLIVLYRESIARQYISTQRAVASGQWLLRKHEKTIDKNIHIDPSLLREYCEKIKHIYKDLFELDWIKNSSVIFSYEDLARDPQSLFDEVICPFLERPSMVISTRLVKQNTKSMHEVVENYNEVESLLTGETVSHKYRL